MVGVLIVAAIGYAIFSKPDRSSPQPIGAPPPVTFAETSSAGSDEAFDQAKDEISGDMFEAHGDTGQCTDDCSGHEAGFQWAAEHEIADPGDCGGTSDSFIEGCQAFGEAVQERAREIEDGQLSDGADQEQ